MILYQSKSPLVIMKSRPVQNGVNFPPLPFVDTPVVCRSLWKVRTRDQSSLTQVGLRGCPPTVGNNRYDPVSHGFQLSNHSTATVHNAEKATPKSSFETRA